MRKIEVFDTTDSERRKQLEELVKRNDTAEVVGTAACCSDGDEGFNIYHYVTVIYNDGL